MQSAPTSQEPRSHSASQNPLTQAAISGGQSRELLQAVVPPLLVSPQSIMGMAKKGKESIINNIHLERRFFITSPQKKVFRKEQDK
jgi:hypothetical protein